MGLQVQMPLIVMIYRVAEIRFILTILTPDDRTKGEDYDMLANKGRDGTLPPEQPYIQTTTLNSFVGMARLLADTQRHTAMMGIAVGAPGVGKSVALRFYQEQLARKSSSSTSVAIQVNPRSTPHSLISQLFGELQGAAPVGQRLSTLDGLAEAIHYNGLHLIMLDQADRLNDACLEFLCSLFDLTGCPLMLVGLPQFLQRGQTYPQLLDRLGLSLKLLPLTFEEILHNVLPALVFPGWIFNPAQEAGYLLAAQLWEYTSPSLRRLCNVVGIASSIANAQQEPVVTHACIQQAMELVPPPLHLESTHEMATERQQRNRKVTHLSLRLDN